MIFMSTAVCYRIFVLKIVYHSKNKLLSKQALNESGKENLEVNTFWQILRELQCRYKD